MGYVHACMSTYDVQGTTSGVLIVLCLALRRSLNELQAHCSVGRPQSIQDLSFLPLSAGIIAICSEIQLPKVAAEY